MLRNTPPPPPAPGATPFSNRHVCLGALWTRVANSTCGESESISTTTHSYMLKQSPNVFSFKTHTSIIRILKTLKEKKV